MKPIEELIQRLNIQTDVMNFDNAALSYLPKPVMDAWTKYHLRRNSQGAEYGQYWKTADKARMLCAKKIGAQPDEIFFIQNTSMGLNFIAKALPFQKGDHVIVTDKEFPSNVYPWMNLKSQGVEIRFWENKNGCYRPSQAEALIDQHTRAVSINWVAAGNGTVLDIKAIGEICRRHKIRYAIDGIQGLGALPIHVKEIGCDFFVSGFFKWMMGPDGIAFVYIRKEILDGIGYPWLGWAGMKDMFDYSHFVVDPAKEARRYETGNMNFSALTALVACLELTDGWEEEIYEKVAGLTARLREGLKEIKGVKLLSNSQALSGITLFDVPCRELMAEKLREGGMRFSVRDGIRISLHFYNTYQQVELLLKKVQEIIKDEKCT